MKYRLKKKLSNRLGFRTYKNFRKLIYKTGRVPQQFLSAKYLLGENREKFYNRLFKAYGRNKWRKHVNNVNSVYYK